MINAERVKKFLNRVNGGSREGVLYFPRCPDSYLEKDSYVNGIAIGLEVRGKGIPATSSGRTMLLVARIFWIILDFCDEILETESGFPSFTQNMK